MKHVLYNCITYITSKCCSTNSGDLLITKYLYVKLNHRIMNHIIYNFNFLHQILKFKQNDTYIYIYIIINFNFTNFNNRHWLWFISAIQVPLGSLSPGQKISATIFYAAPRFLRIALEIGKHSLGIYIYRKYIWVNYNDLTATSLKSWLIRGIIPKWP